MSKLFMKEFEHQCCTAVCLKCEYWWKEKKEGRKKKERKKKREIQMGFTVQLSGIFSTQIQSLSVYTSKDSQYTSSQGHRDY